MEWWQRFVLCCIVAVASNEMDAKPRFTFTIFSVFDTLMDFLCNEGLLVTLRVRSMVLPPIKENLAEMSNILACLQPI